MAYYSGRDGELLIDGVKAGKVRSWSVSASASTLDTTTLEDTDRTVIYGVRSMTGNCSLFYYADNATTKAGNDASVLLNKIIKARTTSTEPGTAADPETVTLRLRISDGTTSGKYIEGSVLITSVSMSMAVGEVLAAEVAFEFNGAPTGVNI
jgi:hypothetical protein